MKTIIQQPEPVKCNGCGCVFSFTKEDVFDGAYMKEGAFLGMLPVSERCKMVSCPVCGSFVQLTY